MDAMLSGGRLTRFNPAAILRVAKDARSLDPSQLQRMEESFRKWALASSRWDVRISRRRILLIFLLIRYTGGRLNEIMNLNIEEDIDGQNHLVRLGTKPGKGRLEARQVLIPAEVAREIQEVVQDPQLTDRISSFFRIDPGHVRRKFYERAKACGFPPECGNPNAIRKSRAIELLRSNLPPVVVQKLLGLSTPGLTASVLDFSGKDMQRVLRYFVDKESRRKTSARNTFLCKITAIRKGDIQTQVNMMTLGGYSLFTVITNESLHRLQLGKDSFVVAEVKAPWVILSKDEKEPKASPENRLRGSVSQIIRGKITTEYIVSLPEGTELCSVVSDESRKRLGLAKDDEVWAMFNSFAVILNVD
jgi:molybdate transport system regulatory protein